MKFYYCYVILTIATLSCSSTRFGVVNAARASESAEPEICDCAPNSFEFTLDFSLACPPVSSALGDGVGFFYCNISPFDGNSFVNSAVTDLVPVSVQSIEFLEFDKNENSFASVATRGGDYKDGDTISFVSKVSTIQNYFLEAIQLNMYGRNKDGEEIINVYQIIFTNACGAYPVLSEGQSIGWTRFVSIFLHC